MGIIVNYVPKVQSDFLARPDKSIFRKN